MEVAEVRSEGRAGDSAGTAGPCGGRPGAYWRSLMFLALVEEAHEKVVQAHMEVL